MEQVIYDEHGEPAVIVMNPERREAAIEKFASLIGLGHKGAPSANGARVSRKAQ